MLRHLSEWIRRTLESTEGTDEVKLRHTLQLLLDTFDVAEVVRSALADENRATVAGKSYRHANGFTKVVLIRCRPEEVPFELRLHDWHPPPEAGSAAELLARESIHDHGWSFASYLASGGLLFEEFEPAANGEEFDQFKYLRPGPAIRYSRVPAGKGSLRLARRGVHRHPDLYCFPRNRLHRTVPVPGEHTVSLLLQSPYVIREGRIFRDPRQRELREPPPQRPLTETELEDTIEGLLPHLEGSRVAGGAA
jgi:hypothetical protein